MLALADAIVDLSALWKIVVVGLVAGSGVVVVFGFGLLGLQRARRDGQTVTGYLTAGVASLFIVAVLVAGVYSMTKKPSTSPKPAKKSAALVLPAGAGTGTSPWRTSPRVVL
jgi:nitrate reductase gamma subunit